MHRLRKNGKRILLFLLLLYFAALIVPYIPHKKVSEDFRKSFLDREFYGKQTGGERVAYIDDNEEALLYRLRMIEEAREEIILSTFDFNDDHAGQDILAALTDAAQRGVSVRVIVDGLSGFLDLRGSPWFQAAAACENMEIRVYNPVNFLKPWKMQARLHDKYLIADRKMYLLRGRNTTNLFLGDYSDSKNTDRELFVYEAQTSPDSSLNQLVDYFERIWELNDSKPYVCRRVTEKVEEYEGRLREHKDWLEETYPQMLAVDCPQLNARIRQEADRDKTYSKVMENGSYSYGENYVSREMSLPKKIFYGILRVVIIPFRRFL